MHRKKSSKSSSYKNIKGNENDPKNLPITVIPIPAVQDISDEVALTKKSSIIELAQTVINMKATSELREYIDELEQSHENFIEKVQHLYDEVSTDINKNLSKITNELRLDISANNTNPTFVNPSIDVNENMNKASALSTGDGSKRLIMYSLIEWIAKNSIKKNGDDTRENDNCNILLIDEPDIFQSPARSSAFYRTLKSLGSNHQIISATHSQRFISISDIEYVRLFRYKNDSDKNIKLKINKITKSELMNTFGTNYKKELNILNRICDYKSGLFADLVVLVEGPADKGALELIDERMDKMSDLWTENQFFDSFGIHVVECDGKGNIPRAFRLLQKLDMPIYVIWDIDNDGDDENRNNQKNQEIFDCLKTSIHGKDNIEITDRYTFFKHNIEDALKIEYKLTPTNVEDTINQIYEHDNYDNYDIRKNIERIIKAVYLHRSNNIDEFTLEELAAKLDEYLMINSARYINTHDDKN